MWESWEMDSLSFMKNCRNLGRTMRTLLQDLAQKSLKGLGTKACTNWEDRSANSLAYQVSNHSIFIRWMSQMRAILLNFKGDTAALELVNGVPALRCFVRTCLPRCISREKCISSCYRCSIMLRFPLSASKRMHFYVWPLVPRDYFVLLQQHDKLSFSHTFFPGTFESAHPI